jgi:hypothetical protein
MNIQSVRGIAKQRGVASRKLKKIELVRKLQRQESNYDCFAKAYDGYCDQSDCLWREDCLSLSTRHSKDS